MGTLEQLYKAPDVLLDAVGQCFRQGLDLELVWIGGGQYQQQLEARAKELGLSPRVRFLGQLPAGDAVRGELDRADLFVLPSRQEGLPRAMLEAMARGLPCIGSTVGGIPELLPAEDLVPPGDTLRWRRRSARSSATRSGWLGCRPGTWRRPANIATRLSASGASHSTAASAR